MSNNPQKPYVAALIFYLIIAFEIVYMISPFAMYYYSVYGPSLNVFHSNPHTAWLSGFFLPHIVETSSDLLNSCKAVGWTLALTGFLCFLIGAGQIYFYQFTKRGAVTGGIYKVIRHPQYVALSITGLGLLLVWPRFLVLIMYITMLFVYFFLAKHEERECEEKYGESYRAYKSMTSMFIPGRVSAFHKLPALPKGGPKRLASILLIYLIFLTVSVTAAFALRDYSLSTISTLYSENSSTIGIPFMNKEDLEQTLRIALEDAQVQSRLKETTQGHVERFLNYVSPSEWYFSDIPFTIPEGMHGHYQPEDYDRDLYKILFTQAKLKSEFPVSGRGIIKNTIARIPVLEVNVNRATGKVIGIDTPPSQVRWGDIPTPLF